MDTENTSPSKTVLVVEDERPLARALEMKLKEAGFEVDVMDNGKSALEAVSQKTFGLIILDILMPKMNGLKFLEEMVKKNIEIPVIVASNLSREDEIKEAKRLGAVDYFIKSETSLGDIVSIVEERLNG
ncbi:response regulator [candidate division WWE3 bacterium]|uniref:Response regulator n=1 Tax=candidate division WWE3 bacterium TaxID=2053526 RepID=A0A955LH82_UNCKA|nr:response regulator [candidate division WWE3 bacterium]